MANNFIDEYQPVVINNTLIDFFITEPWRFGILNINDNKLAKGRGESPPFYYLIESLPLLVQGYALLNYTDKFFQVKFI
jgi:hypothetical protein